MQADFIGVDEHKHKKANSVKKLEFEGENAAFIFQGNLQLGMKINSRKAVKRSKKLLKQPQSLKR